VSLLVFVACTGKATTAHPVSTAGPATTVPAQETEVVDPVLAASGGCSALDEAACFASPACMLSLDPVAQGYACRAPSGPCEAGFVQADTATCPVARGCELVPGSCYCPPTVACICGGGEPPGCARVWADTPPPPPGE